MKISNQGEIIADNVKVARTFWAKLRGKFMIKSPLLLENCNSIHTLFMRKKIDVVFIDKSNKVIKKYENLNPRCIIFPVLGAKSAIEFDAGFLKNAKINLGDMLVLEK